MQYDGYERCLKSQWHCYDDSEKAATFMLFRKTPDVGTLVNNTRNYINLSDSWISSSTSLVVIVVVMVVIVLLFVFVVVIVILLMNNFLKFTCNFHSWKTACVSQSPSDQCLAIIPFIADNLYL